ncbi:hypothetical protein N7457_008433 [Penicillium paradoxum]|uniref:uncharacterized protein n=1 Tax=Penicillium paradoxum TaxID=176176 RepID=UPI002547E637|nr:uncharacterized protein N7457_008433 [Penicillium paradoxum]KAJ5773537.1 hypothetical protein N7457_008433 [Penicillium paradoxum]
MRVQGQLMWLVHVLPAVALTITAPGQSIPSSIPVSDCSSVNLVEDVAFETIDLDNSAWSVMPPKGGVTVDGYLHLSSEAIQSQTLLVQTVAGAVAEEIYTFAFDFRQTAEAATDDDSTTCTVDVMLSGEDVISTTHTAGTWKTISKQWKAVSSGVDIFVVIECPDAIASDTTVDVKNVSFKKPCGSSSETSTAVPTQTSSPSASSSAIESSPSSSETNTAVPTQTSSPSASSSAIESSASTPISGKPTSSYPVTTSPPEMTTSTVFTTRTSTITACPTTVPHCPASEQTTYTTTETIVVSTTVCPVEETTTTATGPSSTGSSGHGNGNGNDHTISTILSTRTVTLTECPATVTDCPARDQTTHVTTETLVAGTTSVPINTAVTITAPGAAEPTPVVHVGGNGNGNEHGSGVSAGEGSTGPESGSSGSGVSAGHGAGHVSHLPGAAHSPAVPSYSLTRISSATVNVPVAASTPTVAGAGAGTNTESGNAPSASPVFNGASSFAVSGVVSTVGAIAALALFL